MRTRPGEAGAASEQLAAPLAAGMKMNSTKNLIPIKGFRG
jgi:hypothetical protein